MLVAAATSLAMAFVVSSGGSIADAGFDPYYFGEMGRSIANGDGFAGFGNLIQRRAPLYPIMLGGIYFVFGEHDRVALFVHCVLFVGIAYLAFCSGAACSTSAPGSSPACCVRSTRCCCATCPACTWRRCSRSS